VVKNRLGIFSLTSIGVGAIIGSGIFAIPAAMGAVAGPGLILGIFLSGIIAIFLAMPYAELGAAFPIEGGPYAFPRLAMGDLTGFLMGWGYFIYLFVGTAGIIQIFIIYLGYYFPGLADGGVLTAWGIFWAVVFVWIFTIINIFGVQWGSLYSVITTIGKLIPLFLFAFIGFAYIKTGNFEPFLPYGFVGVTISITLFFWSYTGFEAIVVPTTEIKKPHVTIPWSMVLTLLITIVAYMVIGFSFVGMIDWKNLGMSFHDWHAVKNLDSPLADISKALGLGFLATIATIGAIIATGGSGGSWVLIQGRMPHAMAKDRLFWKLMGKENNKFQTPMASLIFSSLLTTIVLIALPSFPSVALIASITAVLPYAAAALSIPILRHNEKRTQRPFRLPWQFFLTAIAFVLSTFLIYWASWPWTVVGSVLLLTGYPAFLLVRKKHADWVKSLWIPTYLLGIVVMSILGDPHIEFNNFTPWHPLGIFVMPYDLIILTLFSLLIYIWGYKVNIRKPALNKK